jgi:hypothetical protein
MIAMRVVQMPIDQIVHMVAMRDSFVSAARTVLVGAFDLGRATGRRGRVDRDYVLVDMIAVDMVQVAIMEVVDVV